MRAYALALCLAVAGLPAAAECRLALLLALDISSSVDEEEDRLQRQGLAAALVAPEVREAFLALPERPVALAVYEWSGRWQQDVLLEWTMIRDEAMLTSAAETIAASTRSYAEFPTAVGYALGYAAARFARAPACDRRTLDVSGDGVNNEGFGPEQAYREFPLDGITVNGLAILGGGRTGADDAALVLFYRERLIRGTGSFVEIAADFTDFERAIRRKLQRELSSMLLGRLDEELPRPRRYRP